MLTADKNITNLLKGKAKTDLTNNILEESSHYLKGSQLMELNKTLNKCFEGYEIFVLNEVDLHEDYREENKLILADFLSNKKIEGLSPRTIEYYERTISHCLEVIDKHVSDITTEDIREYFTWYPSQNNCSNQTLDNMRRNLSSFFGTLNNEGIIRVNPMTRIKKIKSAKKVKKPYTDMEVEKMRDALQSKVASGDYAVYCKYRDLALFELLLSSGIRLDECAQLNKDDIDLANKCFIVLGKGNKERECYFSTKAQYFLDKLINEDYGKYNKGKALFQTKQKRLGFRLGKAGIERRIRDIGKSVGVKAHPHKFRRTFATNLLHKGVPIEQIKDLMGHSNIDTTLIYASVDKEQVKYNHNKFAG